MTRRLVLNSFLLIVLVALAGFQLFVRPSPEKPNFEFLPQMVRSERYNAFAPNPNFADGKTLQPPPAGSLARGYMPLHYAATKEDALRAGEELLSPVTPKNERAVQRGQVVFRNVCAPCHGQGGLGDGAVTRKGYPPPPSLLADNARNLKDGQMFHIISFGQGNMPSHATQLERSDRWDAIAYVRTLQTAAAAPPPQPAPTPPAAVAAATSGGK